MSVKRAMVLLVAIGLLIVVLLAPESGSAAPPSYTLTSSVVGSGSLDPTGGSYKKNTNVTITATSDPGWLFDHWEGDLSGDVNPTSIRMDANKHVVAVFVEDGGPTPTPDPTPTPGPTPIPGSLRAGLRSSPYGISPFPAPDWWVNSITDMASRFQDATPATVWTIGEVLFPVDCGLGFPNPTPGTTYPNIVFKSEVDENEAYLDAFDQAGIQVWLQVEPGDADVSTLIDLILTQYGHHPSVVGFGVDVEWYQYKAFREGKAVTDAEAQTWSELVRSYDSDYALFTKHWLASKMSPTYRTGMMFLNDSQGFRSLDAMVSEFVVWGQTFAPADVGFQYGYARDRKWWKHFADPPGEIGQALLDSIPNTSDLVWVDFTADEIWPLP